MIERMLIVVAVGLLAAGAFSAVTWRQRAQAGRSAPRNGRPTLLYFRSDHCAPCLAQGRFVRELQEMLGAQVVVEKIDADTQGDVAARYGVFTLPTTLVIDGAGAVRHANYGLADTRKLAAQVLALETRAGQGAANFANFTKWPRRNP